MNHITHILFLAGGTTPTSLPGGSGGGAAGAGIFWATPAGGILKTLLAVVGVIVVLGAIGKIGHRVLKGEKGGIMGPVLIALFVGAICFQPELINSAIAAMSTVVSDVFSSFGSLFSGGGTPTTTVPVAMASHVVGLIS